MALGAMRALDRVTGATPIGAEHTITFLTELRNEDGRAIPMTSEKRWWYLLRVEGRSDFGRSPTVIREMPIDVR